MHNIPTYVYILFVVLLYIGIKRCFTRTISVSRLILAPALFIFLSLNSTINLFGMQTNILVYLALGGICGIALGYRLVHKQYVEVYKGQNLIQIPGNVFMLFLVMIIFFIEFFIHYAIDAHWDIITHNGIKLAAIFTSGLAVGTSVGRNLSYYVKFVTSK